MTKDERIAHLRAIASRGGKATVAKHGREHMSRIGKLGFIATLETRGYSDAGHMIHRFIELGKMPKRR